MTEQFPSEAASQANEAQTEGPRLPSQRWHLTLIAASVGVVSICGIIYQLVVGTVSTYLQGNSTLQFSLTVGLFMSAYGLGAFASTYVRRRLLDWFVLTEIVIGLLGGLSAFFLFFAYAWGDAFGIARVTLILSLGTLVGLEIPLLIRITEDMRQNLRMTVGQMLGMDYLGALVGGIGFPLLLLPVWGVMGSALMVGLVNALVAVGLTWAFRHWLVWPRRLIAAGLTVALVLGLAMANAKPLEFLVERELYQDPIVHIEQSAYQKIVMTHSPDDLRLFLDGSLQFSSRDEYRYHESLVHPAASRLERAERVLVLGGGDGLALRELLAYDGVRHVTLVDLDPAMVRLGREHHGLRELNQNAFERLSVDVLNEDAFNFVLEFASRKTPRFDLIVVDLPDPHHESLAKLYSRTFYEGLHQLLAENGLMSLQLGSPFFANRTYWCAVTTLREAGWQVQPYHANVPSFGEWGFALAARGNVPERPLRAHLGRYYDSAQDAHLFAFPKDLTPQTAVVANTLMRPAIVEYFQKDWRSWN